MAGVAADRQKVSSDHLRCWIEQSLEREVRFNRSEEHPQAQVDLPECASVDLMDGQVVVIDEDSLHLCLDFEACGVRVRCTASLESVCAVEGSTGAPVLRLAYYVSPAEISRS
jgi:hypothetical protein